MAKIDYKKLLKDVVSKDELKYALMNPAYDCDNDVLVATNGHLLLKIDNVSKDLKIVTQERTGMVIIPMRIFEMLLEFEKPYKGIQGRLHYLHIGGEYVSIWKDIESEKESIYREKIIDEQYPDYATVIPKRYDGTPEVSSIGIDLRHMKSLAMALNQGIGPLHIEFNFAREIAPTLMYCSGFNNHFNVNLTILLMPVRLSC